MIYRIKKSNGAIVNWSYEKLFSSYSELGITIKDVDYIFFNLGKSIKGVSIIGVF